MDMALYLVGYLGNTKDMPLVLGGNADINVEVTHDASHGTGIRERGITGYTMKCNPDAGAVAAKSIANSLVTLSSFETEMVGTTNSFKAAKRLSNTLKEYKVKTTKTPRVRNDNIAMINFVKGEGAAKGVRHMEMRMWYTREEYQKANVDYEYTPGKTITSDHLTKLANVGDHRTFTVDIQGLKLLGYDYWEGK
jgi:hypothetical protein